MPPGILWPDGANCKVLYHLENTSDSSGNSKTLTQLHGGSFVTANFGVGFSTNEEDGQTLERGDAGGIDWKQDTTIVGWVKFASLPDDDEYRIVFHGNSYDVMREILVRKLSGVYYLMAGSYWNDYAQGAITISPQKWYHFAVTGAEGTPTNALVLYWNGAQVASDTVTQYASHSRAIKVGYDLGGILDEVVVYQEVKSAQWIRKYYAWAMGKL